MVELNFSGKKGQVFVVLEIRTLLTWYHHYSSVKGLHFSIDATTTQPTNGFCVGTTEDLSGFSNNWDISFSNSTGNEQRYEVAMEWFVAEADNKQTSLGKWHQENSIKPGVPSVTIKDSADFI